MVTSTTRRIMITVTIVVANKTTPLAAAVIVRLPIVECVDNVHSNDPFNRKLPAKAQPYSALYTELEWIAPTTTP